MACSRSSKHKSKATKKRHRSTSPATESEPKHSRPNSDIEDIEDDMEVDDESEDELAMRPNSRMYYFTIFNIYLITMS